MADEYVLPVGYEYEFEVVPVQPEAPAAEIPASAGIEPAVEAEAEVAAARPQVPVFAPLPELKPLSLPVDFGTGADEDVGLRGTQEQVCAILSAPEMAASEA